MKKHFYILVLCFIALLNHNAIAQVKNQNKEIKFFQGNLPAFEKHISDKNKPGVVYLYSNGQRDCMALNRMLQEKEMVQYIDSNFVAYKVDVEENPYIALQYGVETLPAVIIIDTFGREHSRIYGYRMAKDFRKFLNVVLE